MAVGVFSRLSRWIFRVVSFLSLLVFALFVLAISSGYLLKRYLINHSEEWTGRKIDIGSIFINPFNCSVTFHDFIVFERADSTVFFSLDKLFVDARLMPIIKKQIVIEELAATDPRLRVVMAGSSFNYDDLVERFSTDDEENADENEEDDFPTAYAIRNLKIAGGRLNFVNATFHSDIGMNAINASCPVISSDDNRIRGKVSLTMASGGSLESTFNVNLDNERYNIVFNGEALDISFLLPYIDKVMYVTAIDGKINTNLKLGGNFDKPISEAHGVVSLSDFEMLDTLNKPSLKMRRMEMQLDTVSALKGNYVIRKVLIDDPYLKFDLTPVGNNFFRYYTSSDSTSTDGVSAHVNGTQADAYLDFFKLLNDYFVELGKAYAIHFYSIDSLRLAGGKLEFDDYTLNRKFHFLLEDMQIQAAKIRSDQDSLKVDLDSRLNRSGLLDATLTLMPRDTGDLLLSYSIRELNINDFSPYSEYYVAHPFWDGVVYFDSKSSVVNSQLVSKNHLRVKHLEVGDKVVNATALNLPLKLGVSLLKDVKGNIDLKIPLKGNINDPDFRVFPIVMQILKNLIVKAAASPYKLLARTFNASEESLRDIKYDYLQSDIEKRQKKSIKELVKVLNQKEDLHVKLVYLNNDEWEKNQYALYECKLRFYCQEKGVDRSQLTEKDSIAVDQVQRLDTAFVAFLKTSLNKNVSADIEAACLELVGEADVLARLKEVSEQRMVYLDAYLREHLKDYDKYTIEEASEEQKKDYRDRPKFLMNFGAQSDSTSSVSLARGQ